MADKSAKHPKGIIEDVLVKVNDFIFPVDFIVLDMEEDKDTPLILGRPFLATEKALIDVARGEITLQMGSKRSIVSIYNTMRSLTEEEWKLEKKRATMHELARDEVKKEEETDGIDTNIPCWMFDTETGISSKAEEETNSYKMIGKKFKKTSYVVKPKLSWWENRLAKMFIAEAKKKKGKSRRANDVKPMRY